MVDRFTNLGVRYDPTYWLAPGNEFYIWGVALVVLVGFIWALIAKKMKEKKKRI